MTAQSRHMCDARLTTWTFDCAQKNKLKAETKKAEAEQKRAEAEKVCMWPYPCTRRRINYTHQTKYELHTEKKAEGREASR